MTWLATEMEVDKLKVKAKEEERIHLAYKAKIESLWFKRKYRNKEKEEKNEVLKEAADLKQERLKDA
jgi:hypothetical protein